MALPYKTIIMPCENTVKNISLYCCHIGRCLFSHIYPFWNCYIQISKIDDIVSAAYIIIFHHKHIQYSPYIFCEIRRK